MKLKSNFRLSILLMMTAILILALPTRKETDAKFTTTFLGTFDTVIVITAYAESQEKFDEMAEIATARFTELSRLFDIYNEYDGINNMKTINESGAIVPIEVPWEIIDLLEIAKEWHTNSNGKMNIAFGSVLNIWHRYREMADSESEHNEIPSMQELKEAEQHTNIEDLIIDHRNSTVFLNDPKMRLDVGSIAKGYATELVAKELTEAGYSSFAISAGGNVRVGSKPLSKENATWVIGIQAPDDRMNADANSGLMDKVFVNNTSVVTSGDYQRYFYSDGVKYHHLIDPETLQPAHYYRSVTVIAEDSGVCDVLSTILFLTPYAQAIEFLQTLDGVEAVFVLQNNSVRMTDGMSQYLK